MKNYAREKSYANQTTIVDAQIDTADFRRGIQGVGAELATKQKGPSKWMSLAVDLAVGLEAWR